MRITRFYQETIFSTNSTCSLTKEAAHHAAIVLRLKVGDSVILFNGDGYEYTAQITSIQKQKVMVSVQNSALVERESPLQIHLGQVISKNERMDFTLQKSVELGVTHITPLFSTRMEVRLKGERLEKKMEHWKNIVISACEQCGRNRLPELSMPIEVSEWVRLIENSSKDSLKCLLDPKGSISFSKVNISQQSVILLIGPEGGLTQVEVDDAESHGFTGITLGPRILRTETAGLAAISALQCKAGDF